MIEIEIEAEAALKKMDGFNRQLPFAAAVTINKTAESIQSYLRNVTYPKAGFKRRNQQLPKALTLFRRSDRANKRKFHAKIGPAMGRGGYVAGEGFTDRQRSGATKVAKGSAIAIPQIKPGLRRLKGGSISKGKKPRANPKLIKIKGRGGKHLLVERQRKKLVTRYVLTKTARGTRPLSRFESDVEKQARRTIPVAFHRAMRMALKTAR